MSDHGRISDAKGDNLMYHIPQRELTSHRVGCDRFPAPLIVFSTLVKVLKSNIILSEESRPAVSRNTLGAILTGVFHFFFSIFSKCRYFSIEKYREIPKFRENTEKN